MYDDIALQKILQKVSEQSVINADIEIFLKELREEARKNYIPVMRDKTACLLGEIVRKKQPEAILEIGTSIGTSGIVALSNCNGHLTTIDNDDNVQSLARIGIAACNLSTRCQFILGDCDEVVSMMTNNRYDFIILDGPKSHYLDLYEMLIPMLKSGGIMFIDDTFYHDLVGKSGFIERKHRTIVNAMQKFLDRINSDDKVIATTYDIEDGVVVAEKK